MTVTPVQHVLSTCNTRSSRDWLGLSAAKGCCMLPLIFKVLSSGFKLSFILCTTHSQKQFRSCILCSTRARGRGNCESSRRRAISLKSADRRTDTPTGPMLYPWALMREGNMTLFMQLPNRKHPATEVEKENPFSMNGPQRTACLTKGHINEKIPPRNFFPGYLGTFFQKFRAIMGLFPKYGIGSSMGLFPKGNTSQSQHSIYIIASVGALVLVH